MESGHYFTSVPCLSHFHFHRNPVWQIKHQGGKKSLRNEKYRGMIHHPVFSVNVDSLYFFSSLFERKMSLMIAFGWVIQERSFLAWYSSSPRLREMQGRLADQIKVPGLLPLFRIRKIQHAIKKPGLCNHLEFCGEQIVKNIYFIFHGCWPLQGLLGDNKMICLALLKENPGLTCVILSHIQRRTNEFSFDELIRKFSLIIFQSSVEFLCSFPSPLSRISVNGKEMAKKQLRCRTNSNYSPYLQEYRRQVKTNCVHLILEWNCRLRGYF